MMGFITRGTAIAPPSDGAPPSEGGALLPFPTEQRTRLRRIVQEECFQHRRGLPISPGSAAMRAAPGATDAPVIALPKMPAVIPPSVIVCHRPPNNIDKIAHNGRGHPGQTDGVECGEAIQEIMNNVVRYANVPHRIDYRRQHVCQRHYGDMSLGTRFLVLRHAEAIAA